MGAGCSSAAPVAADVGPAADAPTGPRPGHVYLSYHRADTGDQRAEGGDGAAVRVRDWLVSRGYVVLMGEVDDDAAGGPKAAGVQSGPLLVWHQRMQLAVEQCGAFVALCSEHYGDGPEAPRELHAADTDPAVTLLPLWHGGAWPPPHPAVSPLLGHLERVPRGPRPLCRAVLEGVMGELVDRLQQLGCMPPPKIADGTGTAAAAGVRTVAYSANLDWCFQPGPDDPKEEDYALVKCYTRQLQELVDRLSLTIRPTILDLGGETFSGDLPRLTVADADTAAALSAAGNPANGGTLLVTRPHVTIRNGSILLRQDQELRILAPGCVLDTLSVLTESRSAATRFSKKTLNVVPTNDDGTGGGGGGGGGFGMGYGGVYETGRAMIVMAGCVGLRATRCQFTNHGPHLAVWLAAGATAAMRDCQVEARDGAGVWVRDAGSTLVAQACHFQHCCGPCVLLEAGASAQLSSCSVSEAGMHSALGVGSGSTMRADKCSVTAGGQVGISMYGGATVELVGCEVMTNALAGAECREPGTSVSAIDCKFAQNGQAGLVVAEGGSATLTSCGAGGNKSHGVLVRGQGTSAVLRQVTTSYNNQAGVLVNGGARVDLSTCEAAGNKMCALIVWGLGSLAVASDCKMNTNVQAGLAIKDGGRAELTRCTVKANKLPCEVGGAGSRLGTRQCVIDEKPIAARGGVVEELPAEKKQK